MIGVNRIAFSLFPFHLGRNSSSICLFLGNLTSGIFPVARAFMSRYHFLISPFSISICFRLFYDSLNARFIIVKKTFYRENFPFFSTTHHVILIQLNGNFSTFCYFHIFGWFSNWKVNDVGRKCLGRCSKHYRLSIRVEASGDEPSVAWSLRQFRVFYSSTIEPLLTGKILPACLIVNEA